MVKASVYRKLLPEYAKQKVRGEIDRFVLLRTMLTELSSKTVSGGMVEGAEGGLESSETNRATIHQMDVPLNLRLMVRNIGAFQELAKKYDVDMEALYQELKAA